MVLVASLMPRLLDKMYEAQTLHTKYEQVLNFDKKMRYLATHELPLSLSSQSLLDPSWPCWVRVCRRNLTVTSAHKIIMIHRTYLGLSFSDKSFNFTRKTCIAAAKTILNEFKQDQFEESPLLWTMQAFSVAAAVSPAFSIFRLVLINQIILSLDNFNQKSSSTEYREHRQTVEETISILTTSIGISSIAARGTRLLTDLLAEEQQVRQSPADTNRTTLEMPKDRLRVHRGSTSLNVSAFVKKFCESEKPAPQPVSPIETSHVPLWLHDNNLQDPGNYQRGNMSHPNIVLDKRPSAAEASLQHAGTGESASFVDQYNMSSRYAQEHFGSPFGQNFTETFDIRSVNWFDDLLGLVPSHSL